eukprot:1143818-Pelagomonas_calceolata.AAC.1
MGQASLHHAPDNPIAGALHMRMCSLGRSQVAHTFACPEDHRWYASLYAAPHNTQLQAYCTVPVQPRKAGDGNTAPPPPSRIAGVSMAPLADAEA